MSRKNNRASVASSRSLRLSPDLVYSGAPRAWTLDEVRDAFGPARSLGASEDIRLAMDSQLASEGVYSLIQHTLQLGQGTFPQFMGYGALQNIAQNGLIRACVEIVADDMTRSWISLKEGNQENGASEDFVQRLDEAQSRVDLRAKFHEAAELVGYEGGAFIFIDTGASGSDLATPLHIGQYGAEISRGSFLRFAVIDPVNVFPGEYDSLSPLKPDYFRPNSWWVLGQKVHASRLIRLVANETPMLLRPAYNFLGIPQAQILWDYVLHFQECRAAEARLLTKFSLVVFKTNMGDILTQSGGTGELDLRIRYMIQNMSNDGVLAIDKDTEEVVKLETPLSGVTDIVKQALEFLAALNRTPAVKLLGISPSGFNATGESDLRNYYDHIRSQQEKVFRAGIEKALKCLQLQTFGNLETRASFEFEPLGEEDRSALAVQQKTKADTIAVYLDMGVISPEEARKAMASDPSSGFAFIDPGEIPDEDDSANASVSNLDDADKAGEVYDAYRMAKDAALEYRAAMDAEKDEGWRTADNGKRYQIDPDSGEITKGNVGQKSGGGCQSRPLESTAPDTARYQKLLKEQSGDHQKVAHKYFKEKLQGRHVVANTDEGPIEATFTGASWQELKRGMKSDPVKAELVPYLPAIISSGAYSRNELYKERSDGTTVYHSYQKKVPTSEGMKTVIVDVAERENPESMQAKYQVYSLNREGTENYKHRMKKSSAKKAGQSLPPAEDSLMAINISPLYEVVNIRFADE